MTEHKKRLLQATLVSFAPILLFFAFLPDVSIKPIQENKSEAFVKATDEYDKQNNDITAADLNDYAPMFLPTKWNFSGIKPSLPKTSLWKLPENTALNAVAETLEIVPIDSRPEFDFDKKIRLSIFMRSAFINFATNSESKQIQEPKESTLLIKNLSNGKNILTLKIPQSSDVNAINIAEFLLRFSDSIMQTPILHKSSGSEKNDKHLLQIIREQIGPLPNGDFKVIIIP